jgi:hypothetical protein
MYKCETCGKRLKENTYGDLRYCQGHTAQERKERSTPPVVQARRRNEKG